MPVLPAFDCERALAACARGEQAALRELYAAEGARLLGVAQRIVRDRPLAEDIVHDTFVKVWQKAASFDPLRGEARGWLYSITRHLALNAVRDRQREVTVDEEMADALDIEASVRAWQDSADSFDWRSSSGRLGHCLERLDAVRRNCLLHAYVDGLSHSQIAERVGAPLGTVKAWIQRSLASLKGCMA